jgi:ABC-type lipoprotein release transport system permease subunit
MMRVLAILFPFAWRNLWRNQRRTFITLAVVAVGVWSILAFNAVVRAWSDSALIGSLRNMTADAQIHAPGYRDNPEIQHSFPIPTGRLAGVLSSKRISAWAARVRTPAIIQSEYRTLPVTLVGMDPQQEVGVSFIADARIQGRMLENSADDGVLLGRHLADHLETRVGKRIVIMANDARGKLQERGARVIGIYAAEPRMEDAYLFTGLQPAQQFLRADGLLSEIALMTPTQQQLAGVLRQLRQAAPQLDIADWAELQPMTKGIHDITEGFIYVWLLVMFVLIAIGVVNTQLMAVFERTREFGLLQALGFRPGWVVLEVVLEAVQIIGFGVFLGAVSAYLTVQAMQGGISLGGLSAGADFLGIERILYPRLDGSEFFITICVIWGLGVATAVWPARRAARFNAIDAMRASN